ncbi:Protein of unknown function [Paenibacillus sp. 1_12]|uniref:DUF3105 domain-containing protein n=1 Tax=Paenibacillus sp. 1_12 TaxID=1566278 RepID=UPI0008E6F9A7|nr:DUF3105 domain-containing protein [Paenibacillus sp. 1_12]SFM18059.1 Protein of unknown function [Paenibacillus sp. 1_12]
MNARMEMNMDMHANMQHGTSTSTVLLYVGLIILVLSIVGYMYASQLKRGNTSALKKAEKVALKKKNKTILVISHSLLSAAIVVVGIFFIQNATSKTNIENLNYKAAIQVTDDKDYGRGHSDAPVSYDMKLPTSGTHSPHDLKYGFYKEKPVTEMLVHNLEHGDIIIYYHPNAKPELIDKITALTHYKKAGSGVLAVPFGDVQTDKEVVVNAWTKTMELTTFDETMVGTFIYNYINKGPEEIPVEVRQNGGTM